MKIVLATPLFPPDVAPPAAYAKELAARLTGSHAVTIVAYARLPERVLSVRMVRVEKRLPLPIRLVAYFLTLFKEALRSDALYALNGASVELPAALIARLLHKPLILHVVDQGAHEQARKSRTLGAIERFARKSAVTVLEDPVLIRPEILPLEARPVEALAAYEAAWASRVNAVNTILAHVS